MNSVGPKRRFWQIHLSTAIAMMLTASGFIYIQTRGYAGRIVVVLDADYSGYIETRTIWQNYAWDPGTSYGWPFCFFHAGRYKSQWIPVPALLQLLIFFLIIALTAFLCESFIRRRARRGVPTDGK